VHKREIDVLTVFLFWGCICRHVLGDVYCLLFCHLVWAWSAIVDEY